MDGKAHQSYHLDPIGKMTVVDEIVERLMGLIIDENLKPGDKLLTERELMERLAVGRSSLREAIKTRKESFNHLKETEAYHGRSI